MKRLVSLFATLLSLALIGLMGCGGDEEVGVFGPVISYVAPRHEATGVPTTASVFVTFDKMVNPPTAANLVFTPGIGGTVSYDSDTFTAIFKPAGPMAGNTDYSLKISGVTDPEGNSMSPVTVKFKTGTGDATRPVIEHSYPVDNQKDIGVNDAVKLIFSEDIDRTNFWDGITFSPSVDREGWFFKWSLAEPAVEVTPPAMGQAYELNEDYAVVIDSDSVSDLSGNRMSSDYVISFKTFRYPLERIGNLTIPNAMLEPQWLFHVGRAGGNKWLVIAGGQRPAKGPSNTTGSGTVTASADGRIGDAIDFWEAERRAPSHSVTKGNGNRLTFASTLDQADDFFRVIFSSSSRFLTFQLGVSKEWIHVGLDQKSPSNGTFALEND